MSNNDGDDEMSDVWGFHLYENNSHDWSRSFLLRFSIEICK